MSSPYFRTRRDLERDQPAVLLRDTPEDRERLAHAVHWAHRGRERLPHFFHSMICPSEADAIIAALRERP